MRTLASSKKGSSLVLASVLTIIVTLVAGIFFYNFVMGSVESMKTNLNTQLSILLLDSVKMNSTHIIAWIHNTGNSVIDVLNAYVNNRIGILANEVKLAALSAAPAVIMGTYAPGSVYSVKLAGMFGTLLTFEAKYQ